MSLLKKSRIVITIWIILILSCIGALFQISISTDLSFFLPEHPNNKQQVIIDQLSDSSVSRILMMEISGGNSEVRAKASKILREKLKKSGRFILIQNGESGDFDDDVDFLFKHRYQLSSAISSERFTVEGLKQAISNNISLLTSPFGSMIKPYFTADPTGEMFTILSSLQPPSEPQINKGVWSSSDGDRAILLAQTTAKGSDTDGQLHNIELVNQNFNDVRKTVDSPTLTIEMSGPGVFAVEGRELVRSEIHWLSLTGSILIISLLLFAYRSLRLLGLGVLPVITGALTGIIAVWLVFGTVFGITIAFGCALIGESIDYSIYFLVQSSHSSVRTWREHYWPTIRLGMLTSMVGFGMLMFSGFPGLSQLGVFSLCGVFSAAMATRYLLPIAVGNKISVREFSKLNTVLKMIIGKVHHARIPIVILTGLALAYLFTLPQIWTSNLSTFSTVNQQSADRDHKFRNDFGAPNSRYMIVITASSLEEVLQQTEKTSSRLTALVQNKHLDGFDSPSVFLPSIATQKKRLADLPDSKTLSKALEQAAKDLPVSAEKLSDFIKGVGIAKTQTPLTLQGLKNTSFDLIVGSMIQQKDGQWTALIPIRQNVDNEMPVEKINSAINDDGGGGALFIDLRNEVESIYVNYSQQANYLSLAGFIAIVILLGFAVRSFQRWFNIMLPLMLAIVLVITGLKLLQFELNIIHLVGMLLIVAVGSNYALFFDKTAQNSIDEFDNNTLPSMFLACLTTTIGFGVLSLSSVSVLHAIGITVGPGAILSLIISAIFRRAVKTA